MSQKIVIISNYFPPEMGAAANRIKNLADGLKEKGNEITIICPLPNYPKGKVFEGYKNKIFTQEIIEGIKVNRYWIFPSKSKNAIIRLLSMLSFAISLWISFFSLIRKRPDVFIVQSPPLLVALSGLLLSKALFCKNILNVSDIWPLSALELGVIKKGFFYSFLEKIERLNYRLADKIIGQSYEIINHINKIVQKDTIVYRNVSKYKKYALKEKNKGNLKIVYAGLLGYAQGILQICNQINFKELNAEFHIYGAGMDEESIKTISDEGNKNIFYHGMKTASEIKEEILKYDVGFVPLKNRIYGAVPSKIFELIQLGMPILFFGDGEGEIIINQKNIGLTSNSGNYKMLIDCILKFSKMSKEEYQVLSKNSLELHRTDYKLENQINNIYENNFLL